MRIMIEFISVAIILGLIIGANVIDRLEEPRMVALFHSFLLVINIPLLIIGVVFVLTPASQLEQVQAGTGASLSSPLLYGIILQLMGLWGILMALRSTRRSLTRITNINPDSAVHTLALLVVGYLAGNVGLLLSQGGLAQLEETAVSATVLDTVTPALLFLTVALVGVGFPIRRRLGAVVRRLGLERPTMTQMLMGTRWIGILVALQWLVGALWAALDPVQAEQLGGINELLLANMDTVWEWLILALAAGIGEEILFRGAMQPILGLPLTALVFAISHVQYGFTPITLLVFVLGWILGRIRQQTNTTVAIYVHAGYNFVLGMIALLVPYLEQAAGG